MALFEMGDKDEVLAKGETVNLDLSKEQIVAIRNQENITTYTIGAYPHKFDGKYYNLVVVVDKTNTIISGDLLEYIPAEDWLPNAMGYFKGKVKIISQKLAGIEAIIESGSLSSRECNRVIYGGYWKCSFGNRGDNHGPGQCNASSTTYILEYKRECNSGGGGIPDKNLGHINVGDPLIDSYGGSGGFPTTPVVGNDFLEYQKNQIIFKLGLGILDQLFIKKSSWEYISKLYSYLLKNPKYKDFVRAIIKSQAKLEDVDFEDKIINLLEDKARCVYEKMVDENNNINWILENFNDGDKPSEFNLNFVMDTELDDKTNATTVTPSNSGIPKTFLIKINANTLGNRTALGVARTILHEGIHARLWEFALRNGGKLNKNDFPGIYNYMRIHLKNWDHEQMASFYRETIAKGLKQFDKGQHIDSFYDALAWEGLAQFKDLNNDGKLIYSNAWKEVENKDEILKIIKNEKENGSKACVK